MSQRMWMIRAGENAYLFEEFKSRSIASISWNAIGDISKLGDKDKIKDQLQKTIKIINLAK